MLFNLDLKWSLFPEFKNVLFKVLVLQALYNLSDEQMEYQIRDRLSFRRFLGLDLHQRIPDAKTIWCFRETLAQAGVVETLFTQFDTYLAAQGLQARAGQLIDASLIPVPTQRNNREENATIKAGDCPTDWETQPAKRRQKDTEARWTVKHGVSHYGYKNHVNVDKQHKLIRRYAVTDAAVHDSQVLEEVLLPKAAGCDVWADAAYRSQEIEAQLKRRKLRSRIQYKGYRNASLTARQKLINRRRARIRARVEHVFGHHVMAMGGKLIRTIGRVRARAKIGLKNLTYNFQRFLVVRVPAGRQTA
jgi:IS5 family transposase